jgi:AP-3 complex subunit delta-1
MSSLQAASDPDSQPHKDSNSTSVALNQSPAYRLTLSLRLLSILSLDTYANVTDFEWVISVLVDLAYVSHVGVGSEIKAMVLDVVGRVKSARTYAVRTLEKVVGDEELRERGRQQTGEDGLLEAAIWVCGEYSG